MEGRLSAETTEAEEVEGEEGADLSTTDQVTTDEMTVDPSRAMEMDMETEADGAATGMDMEMEGTTTGIAASTAASTPTHTHLPQPGSRPPLLLRATQDTEPVSGPERRHHPHPMLPAVLLMAKVTAMIATLRHHHLQDTGLRDMGLLDSEEEAATRAKVVTKVASRVATRANNNTGDLPRRARTEATIGVMTTGIIAVATIAEGDIDC